MRLVPRRLGPPLPLSVSHGLTPTPRPPELRRRRRSSPPSNAPGDTEGSRTLLSPRLGRREPIVPTGSPGRGGGGGPPGAEEMGAPSEVARVRKAALSACVTCPICRGFLREATAIAECLHTCEFSLFLSPVPVAPSRSFFPSLSMPVCPQAPPPPAPPASFPTPSPPRA
jgi:hypothetical protein